MKLYVRLVRKDEQEKRILEIPRKENPRIPLDMGQDTNAGRRDVVETGDVVVVAEEVAAKVPVQPCLGRHQRLVPAKI